MGIPEMRFDLSHDLALTRLPCVRTDHPTPDARASVRSFLSKSLQILRRSHLSRELAFDRIRDCSLACELVEGQREKHHVPRLHLVGALSHDSGAIPRGNIIRRLE